MLSDATSSLLDAMPQAAAIVDRAGELVAMNSAWVALGLEGDAGKAWWAGQLADVFLGKEFAPSRAARTDLTGLIHWEERSIRPIITDGRIDQALVSIRACDPEFEGSALSAGAEDLLNSIAIGVVELDDKGVFKRVNAGYCRLTGYSESELIGKMTPIALTHPRDRPEAEQRLRKLLSLESVAHEIEKRIVKRDGTLVWIRGTVSARVNPDGSLHSVIEVIEDISDRKLIEEALRDSEQRYHFFFNSAGVGTVQLGLDWKFIDANERFCRIVGYRRDELVGRLSPIDLAPPEDKQEEAERFERFFSRVEPHFYREKRFVRKDGKIVHVRISSELILDRDGEPLCTAAVIEDITEIKYAQREVMRFGDRLKLALDAGRLGVWDWPIESDDVYWNDNHYCIFGYEPFEFKPTLEHYLSVIDPEDKDRVLAEMEKLSNIGHEFRITYRLRHLSGERRWVESQGVTILDASGVLRSIGVVRDITSERVEKDARELMLQELNHRTKNVIAVVRSIAVLGDAQSTHMERQAFLERLSGLAQSHDLLVGTQWRGIGLRDLIRAQTGHLTSAMGERFRVLGVDMLLRPSAAQVLGMALHELATNAAKYGSLRSATGTVEISWSVDAADDAKLRMIWKEAGGAPVPHIERSGFGMSVILDACEYSLDADVKMLTTQDGIEWRLECPLRKVQALSQSQAAEAGVLARA